MAQGKKKKEPSSGTTTSVADPIAVKLCRGCKKVKSETDFYFDRGTPSYRCKQCAVKATILWQKQNPEKRSVSHQRYLDSHKEQTRATIRKWDRANMDKKLAHSKAFQKRHPDKVSAYVMRRYAAKKHATPSWANATYIMDMYLIARICTEATGVKYQVDHIVPLRSKKVCGLHVEHNLQVITGADNHAKNNLLWSDMP